MNEFGLTNKERDIALKALRYLIESEALIHEFRTRMGVDEIFVEKLLELDFDGLSGFERTNVMRTYNNALNEICNGLYISEAEWASRFDFAKDEAEELLKKIHESLD